MQQNVETSMKLEDESLSKNVAEMSSTVLQLKTDASQKDLEILSLKQQLLKQETKNISKQNSLRTVCVGDGNVHEDDFKEEREELLASNVQREEELNVARNEIKQLTEQVDETTKSLGVANGRYEQAQRHLEIAEQLARDEKASRESMKGVLEQAQKEQGGMESALALSLQEEKQHAENTIARLQQQIQSIEGKSFEDKANYQKELASMNKSLLGDQSRAAKVEKELDMIVSAHESNIAELKDRHKEKSHRLKEELDNANLELVTVQEQLKEAKMAKFELMVAKEEADETKDLALGRAQSAETKLREMTEFVNTTNKLKESNDQLHTALSKETEQRKVLHNTLEDIKGRIRVYVRVRPLSETELNANYQNVMSKEDSRTCVMEGDAATSSDSRGWEFDKIFAGSDADGNTQDAIFSDTSFLITSAIDGFNVSSVLLLRMFTHC